MIIVNNRIADAFYLTTIESHRNAFESFVKRNGFQHNLSNPIRLHTKVISSPVELMDFVSSIATNYKNNKWVNLIFDYVSFVRLSGEYSIYVEEYRAVVRTLIILYPEYQFFFDETATGDINNGLPQYPIFLDIHDSLLDKEAHVFSAKESSCFSRIISYDNLFDASNLRLCIKQRKYGELNILEKNYCKIQESRSTNLAICVEEERSQNLFNSYATYACGYRSLPVTTATLLKQLNDKDWGKNKESYIILRDYDLQFADEPRGDSEAIHRIRGWKFYDFQKIKNIQFPTKGTCLLRDNNEYWGSFFKSNIPVYYISKGEDFIKISLSAETDTDINEKIGNFNDILQLSETDTAISEKINKLPKIHFRGITKPVSGLYSPFLNIPEVKTVFDGSRDKSKINVKRKTGGHGVPLDIYNWVKDMVNRAEAYYKANRFIHSAVLCQEAMEVMNGFHTALMIKAYSIKAKAENAIAIDILGGSEEELCEDVRKRIDIIRADVKRLLQSDDKEEQSRNVLSQIFSDCRNYCKDKEHFDAEDCFVSAMGHLNEHYSLEDIKKDYEIVSTVVKNIYNNILKKTRKEKKEEEIQKVENPKSN